MLQEKDMQVRPDYGYDTYKGTGKLKGKVRDGRSSSLLGRPYLCRKHALALHSNT